MKKQEKKLCLKELEVQSFITTLEMDEQKEIKGGTGAQNVGTFVRIYC
jgi:hypothetical protein